MQEAAVFFIVLVSAAILYRYSVPSSLKYRIRQLLSRPLFFLHLDALARQVQPGFRRKPDTLGCFGCNRCATTTKTTEHPVRIVGKTRK